MEKELGSDVIKATQTSLGKYVKRPPLSEKLLKKPPFRFLHDIVTSVLKTNGFFGGLFEENELISDNVKDRDSKILFLNKIISVIALTTGKNVSVKSSKIVAGQEPEKTNELLQALAYALDKKLSSDEAVKKYKENAKTPLALDVKTKEKEAKAVKKSNDTNKLTSKSSEKLTSIKKESTSVHKNEKSKTSDPKSKRKESGVSKIEQAKKQPIKAIGKKASVENTNLSSNQPPVTNTPLQNNEDLNPVISDNINKQNEEIKAVAEVINKGNLIAEENTAEVDLNTEINFPTSDQDVQGKFNTSHEHDCSLSSQDLVEIENNQNEDSKSTEKLASESLVVSEDRMSGTLKEAALNPIEESNEIASVKKPRPVLVPKHDSFDSHVKAKELIRNNSHDNAINTSGHASNVTRPQSVRPSSSRPGAPRLREKIDNVIPESDNLLLGKVNIIAESAQNDEEEDTSVIIVEQHTLGSETNSEDQQGALQISSNEHGHLVQQILNSQKELAQVAGKTEIEWQFGAQKAKEASSQEIEQLRFNIQALSRVANPLGKLLDHIQEDVEVMRQELQQWTNVYEEVSKDMLTQKTASEETLVPLQSRVKQLDMDIDEKRDKINDIKIVIHKNTARIEKLLNNGNVQ